MTNTNLLAQKIESIVRQITGVASGPISLHEPVFAGNEKKYVLDCIETGWVSSAGSYVSRFEQMLSDFTGINHAVATVNGTSALHTCLLLAGVTSDHEVLCQALTFVATANAISYCGAAPHFLDVETETLGICPVKLENHLNEISEICDNMCFNKITGKQIKALVVMHTFGHPSKLDELLAICNKFHITLIEDAAEAIGSLYKGKHVGSHGLLSALSFNGNKTITTGGGGAILTNSEDLAQKAKHLTTTGKVPHPWEYFHDCIAYNYRMPNINAALGCAQMEKLPDILASKRAMAENYRQAFSQIEEVEFFTEPKNCKSNYWLNAILLKNADKVVRDKLLNELHKRELFVRPAWELMSGLPMYGKKSSSQLLESKTLATEAINIPSV